MIITIQDRTYLVSMVGTEPLKRIVEILWTKLKITSCYLSSAQSSLDQNDLLFVLP